MAAACGTMGITSADAGWFCCGRDELSCFGEGEIFDAHFLSDEDTIEGGEAEAAAAMKEVGDVRLGQAGASSQQ